MTMFIFHQR